MNDATDFTYCDYCDRRKVETPDNFLYHRTNGYGDETYCCQVCYDKMKPGDQAMFERD
jgi:hypothetical protein